MYMYDEAKSHALKYPIITTIYYQAQLYLHVRWELQEENARKEIHGVQKADRIKNRKK